MDESSDRQGPRVVTLSLSKSAFFVGPSPSPSIVIGRGRLLEVQELEVEVVVERYGEKKKKITIEKIQQDVCTNACRRRHHFSPKIRPIT